MTIEKIKKGEIIYKKIKFDKLFKIKKIKKT